MLLLMLEVLHLSALINIMPPAVDKLTDFTPHVSEKFSAERLYGYETATLLIRITQAEDERCATMRAVMLARAIAQTDICESRCRRLSLLRAGPLSTT